MPSERALLREIVRRKIRLPDFERDLSPYRTDPVAFCVDILKVRLWERQSEIAQSVGSERRTTVRSCHGSGKTYVAACLTHWWAHCFSPSLVITTAPTDRQVREVLWHEIHARALGAGLPGTLNQTSLSISPKQRAHGFTTAQPERFQGHHEENILVIVDEASGVDERIYEAIEGILTGPNARLLLIGNPNSPIGTFFESFRSPLYHPFRIQASDVPEWLLPASWAAERLAEWGEQSPMYQVRCLGNFPPQSPDSLISLTWVEAAQQRGRSLRDRDGGS